ncbi:hypothetical protein HYC85_000401 [Camellia sinensis]|uniref:Uncharacterized protein n=1 Tax=Camellia sinensis TaxID=4442 RepID=A0A7J7I2E3_CAMSI|nr:hypothetical protein HYC85_000401 [Camellia sinensis]
MFGDPNDYQWSMNCNSSAIQSTWTRHEDKVFEDALVLFPEEVADRWEKIADQIPGKSPEEVRAHYEALVHDVNEIESGRVELPSYSDESSLGWETESKASQISFGSAAKTKHGEVERKKGTPWTEEEHSSQTGETEFHTMMDGYFENAVIVSVPVLVPVPVPVLHSFGKLTCFRACRRLFLVGLQTYGKGDWRSISRNMVVTRTPTQVASHAQKFFLRQNLVKKDRKRSSIHDITTAPDIHPIPLPSHFPDQGGSMGYQNFNYPM